MKAFFDAVRKSPFPGRLTAGQVDGLNRIVAFGLARGTSREDLAYILATVFHETAAWMQPIREGARRYGLAYTDAQARRAVASIYAKGVIRVNYALPNAAGNSFYGRGLVQITWEDNYRNSSAVCGVDLVANPDLALEWPYALLILFAGMEEGSFRAGNSLADIDGIDTFNDWVRARGIINGDVKKYGKPIADAAQAFYTALESSYVPRSCVA